MPTIISEFTLTAAIWIGVAAAALVVAASIVALMRKTLAGALVFIAIVTTTAWGAYALSELARDGERRALENRLHALDAAMWVPGSPLGCLGTGAGDMADTACERALFASAETLSSAAAFTAARLSLLRDIVAFAARDASIEGTLGDLRAALEPDRFGFVAHVLGQGHGCTADACGMARLFQDFTKVRANLRDNLFAYKLGQHQPAWTATSEPAGAPAAPPPVAESGMRHAPLPPTFTLPSSESIPPVSIMDPEPATTATIPAPPAAAAAAPPLPPPRTSRPANPNGGGRSPAPLQLGRDRP
jgi:hypothetical protein